MHQRPPVCFPAGSCTATATREHYAASASDHLGFAKTMSRATMGLCCKALWMLPREGQRSMHRSTCEEVGPGPRAGGLLVEQLPARVACWHGQRSIGLKDDDPKERQLSSWGNLTFGDPWCRPFLLSRDSLIHSKERHIHCFYLTYQSNKNHR